ATSTLGRVELMRTVARYGKTGQSDRARYLLDGLDVLPLSETVMTLAESIGPATLRSLDAIHLAVAAHFRRELTAFVTYDNRLLNGCRDIGLATASPGTAV
ncbi:MAG: type II toxin-antitoxin system VapC family toxin, partial [Mycobacterium sp.]|nr:type II toxin-antitoxin system VapC family toxin [Mycobacterium sp.]